MKQLMALILVLALLTSGAALAAQWKEGLGPEQPYSQSPRINLNNTVGYIVLYPRGNKLALGFCDTLEMYFPREDVQIGTGMLHLYEKLAGGDREVCSVNMSDRRSVSIRPMTEREMERIMWGSGVCVQIRLPKSLEFGNTVHQYYVYMDEGCVTAGVSGTLKSPQISKNDAWQPGVDGEYGVSGLYYVDAQLPSEDEQEQLDALFDALEAAQDARDAALAAADALQAQASMPEQPEVEEAEGGEDFGGGGFFGIQEPIVMEEEPEADEAEADETEVEPVLEVEIPGTIDIDALRAQPPVAHPDVGDKVFFDLVLGGEAAVAVPFSENGSVEFDIVEYRSSASVVGTVIKNEVDWGIMFLKADGTPLDALAIGPETKRYGE